MFIVWSGLGYLLVFFFLVTHFLCNVRLYLDYTPEKFSLFNFWLPGFLSAIFTWLLLRYIEKAQLEAKADTWARRFVLQAGPRHSLFWIPIRYWTFIFLGLALWQILTNQSVV